MPNNADAFHLAISMMCGVYYLITWECTHITSARIRKAIGNINEDRGLITLIIYTPEELMKP